MSFSCFLSYLACTSKKLSGHFPSSSNKYKHTNVEDQTGELPCGLVKVCAKGWGAIVDVYGALYVSVLKFPRGADIENHKVRISFVLLNKFKGRLRLKRFDYRASLRFDTMLSDAILSVR